MHRADDHDTAAVALAQHGLGSSLAGMEYAELADFDRAQHIFPARLDHRLANRHSCVGDSDIQPSEAFDGRLEHARYCVAVGNISLPRQGMAALLADSCRDLLRFG